MLQPLPLPAIDSSLAGLEPVNVSARQVVIHQVIQAIAFT
jgi:hypothetical protein